MFSEVEVGLKFVGHNPVKIILNSKSRSVPLNEFAFPSERAELTILHWKAGFPLSGARTRYKTTLNGVML